jgi:hypothetical protein
MAYPSRTCIQIWTKYHLVIFGPRTIANHQPGDMTCNQFLPLRRPILLGETAFGHKLLSPPEDLAKAPDIWRVSVLALFPAPNSSKGQHCQRLA